jgi:hypothetical protein
VDEDGSVLEILQHLIADIKRDVVLVAVRLAFLQVVGAHLDKEAPGILAGFGD